jgi:hypothetical protein
VSSARSESAPETTPTPSARVGRGAARSSVDALAAALLDAADSLEFRLQQKATKRGELRRAGWAFTLPPMRDLDTIDSELRLLAAVRWSIREHGGEPSSRQVDKLLDERLAHRSRAGEDPAVDT